MAYSHTHPMFRYFFKLAIQASHGEIKIKFSNVEHAKYIQRTFSEMRRASLKHNQDSLHHFDAVKTKRGKSSSTVSFLPKEYSIQKIIDVVGMEPKKEASKKNPTHQDQQLAQSALIKAIESRPRDFGDPEYAGNGVVTKQDEARKLKRGGQPGNGGNTKNHRAIAKPGHKVGGLDPQDQVYNYLEQHRGKMFDEAFLRKEVSWNTMPYNLAKFNIALKWLADAEFIKVSGNPGNRKVIAP